MELRTLQYFLAVAEEESITRAAEDVLHVTQPTLSRQIADLEAELGTMLFMRTNKKTLMTEDGLRFRRRAQEILGLAARMKAEFACDGTVQAKICVGTGEFSGIDRIVRAMKNVRSEYAAVSFDMFSANAPDVMEKLDAGILDFGVLLETAQISRYDYIKLNSAERWGLLVQKDSALAKMPCVTSDELEGLPLIVPNQSLLRGEFSGWLGGTLERLNIAATFNLMSGASALVEQGLGAALCLEKKQYHAEGSPFAFVPLHPAITTGLVLAWKKHAELSRAAAVFLDAVKTEIEE